MKITIGNISLNLEAFRDINLESWLKENYKGNINEVLEVAKAKGYEFNEPIKEDKKIEPSIDFEGVNPKSIDSRFSEKTTKSRGK